METGSGQVVITILETSDVHGSAYPIRYADNSHANVGLSKLSTLIKQEMKRNPNTLYIDNGDLVQGTPLTYYHARIDSEPVHPMILGLNELQCACAVIGNHEFNYGLELLLKAVDESHFPWLAANIADKRTGEPFFGKPYLIKRMAGDIKVGVLGLTTHYVPNWENPDHIAPLHFEDVVESARKWVKLLKDEEQVDLLIVSYHGGFERDLATGEPTEVLTGENQGYRLCLEVEGIDILLTGHQHRTISGTQINGVTVVQPGSLGTHLGKVQAVMEKADGKWSCVGKSSELLSVEDIAPDRDLMSMLQPYEDATQKWLDQPMGTSTGDMTVTDPLAVRTKDGALIEFINTVQMDASGADISNTALFDNHSPGFPPNITMRHVVSNYIYPNTLKVIRVSGMDIKNALEKSASYFGGYNNGTVEINPEFLTPKPQHYNYDMWEGIEYTIDISRPIGDRVTQLLYKGKPLHPDEQYDVVMNNYRSGGGGNYTMFQNKPVIKDIPIDMSELIANYILQRGTIDAKVDGNWRVVYGEQEING